MKPRWGLIGGGAVLCALLVASLMAWVDRPLAIYMAQFRETAFVSGFEVITNLANSAIWYAVAIAGIVLAWREHQADRRPETKVLYHQRLRAALYVIVSMVASGLFINALKIVVGRSRPKLFVYQQVYDFAPFRRVLDECSFPSGHSQSIWAAMIAFGFIFPRWRWALIVFAVVVSSSRIVIGAHYASDVLAGAYFALAFAVLARARFERSGTSLALQPI